MSAETIPLRCECGRTLEVPPEIAALGVGCPGCGRPLSLPPSASGPASEPSLEKILLERGWTSQDQIKAALVRIQEEERQGRKVRIGQALLMTGAITSEQLRQALAAQGKAPMRCPSCNKLYNVKGYAAGTRALCRTCGVALVSPTTLGAAPVEDAGEGAALRRVPVGDAVDPALADLIPGYRLERRLGSGGMGDVYLARQMSLDRLVAVKFLPHDMGRDPEYVRRFLAEARAAARVIHENLVAAVDAGESGGRYYFIMEYVEGEPLNRLLKRESPLPERRALEIARHVARGLRHAHQNGLIHRDVKPSNVMIMLDGTAKLCDFGLARETGPAVAIQTGRVLSTPAYASPEQCRGEADLDHRSDMYSLGVMLFEMLVGRPPFQADSPGDLFAQHVTQNPPAPRTLNPQVSPAADQLTLTLLSKPKTARYATYDDLLGALDDALAPKTLTPSRRVDFAQPRSPYAKWIAMGVAGLVTLILLRVMVSFLPSDAGRQKTSRKGAPTAVESALQEARRMEDDARGNPNQYPLVLERWKELERQYRGTPHHALFAGPLVQYEERLNAEATRSAELYLHEANLLAEANRYPEALKTLRSYPPGFAGTEASRRVIARIHEADTRMHERFQAGKEAIFTHISNEKFREAQKELAVIKAFVACDEAGTLEYARPEYAGEIESLAKKIEEEYVLARKRREEARARENTPETPAPPVPVEVKPPATPPTPVAEVKPPPTPPPPPPVPVPAPPPGPAKLPEPDQIAQRKAQAEIQGLFKEEYAKKTPADRLALARKLIETAGQTKDDPVSRFVLYREAQDLAMLAGDFELALGTVDEIAKIYAVNGPALKNSILAGAAKNARTFDELKGVATVYLRQGEDALAADELDEADRLIQQAVALGKKSKDTVLSGRAEARQKEIAEMKPRFDRAKKAREALAANPEDGAAHLALGQYLCFFKNDWTSGLLHLARCADPSAKNAATKDLANPAEAPGQVEAGDAWYDMGERESGMARASLRRRAATWYEKAVLSLSGLTKIKVEKRISDIKAGK
jgi:serine/threonine protein kinase